jgi:hypothetical protein
MAMIVGKKRGRIGISQQLEDLDFDDDVYTFKKGGNDTKRPGKHRTNCWTKN